MTWIFNDMYKTSLITRPPTWTPNSYNQCLLNIYRWVSNIHQKLQMSKTKLLIFYSNTWFGRSFQMLKPKTVVILNSLPFFTFLSNSSAYPVSSTFKTYPNFFNKILEKKLFTIWLTTSHHNYHHHCSSNQYLSLGLLQEPLTWSPCFYLCPSDTCVRSCHFPTKKLSNSFPTHAA